MIYTAEYTICNSVQYPLPEWLRRGVWGNLGQLVSPLCLRVDAHTGKIDASTRWKMSFTTAANEATASPVVVLLIDQSNHRICSQSLPLF